jgi:hypothetical protein
VQGNYFCKNYASNTLRNTCVLFIFTNIINSDFIEVLPRGHFKRSSLNDVDGTRYAAVTSRPCNRLQMRCKRSTSVSFRLLTPGGRGGVWGGADEPLPSTGVWGSSPIKFFLYAVHLKVTFPYNLLSIYSTQRRDNIEH